MKRLFILFGLLPVLISSLMVSCIPMGGGGGGGNNTPSVSVPEGYPNPSELYIYPEPYNSLLAVHTNENGDIFWHYGEKDSNGYPTKVTGFAVKANADNVITECYLHDDGKLAAVKTPNGVSISFDWVSSTSAVVAMVDENSGEQFNTLIDFSGKTSYDSGSTTPSNPTNPHPFSKRSGTATLDVQDVLPQSPLLEDVPTKASKDCTGSVVLTECGAPVNYNCFVDVFEYITKTVSMGGGYGAYEVEDKGKPIGRYYCSRVGDGKYQYHMEFDYKLYSEVKPYVDNLAEKVGKLCLVMSAESIVVFLCPGIAAGIAAIGMGTTTGIAATFYAACASAVAAVSLYCSTYGSLGAPGDLSDSVTELFSKTLMQNLGWKEDDQTLFMIRAGVSGVSGDGKDCNIYGSLHPFHHANTPSEIAMDLGSHPSILDFFTSPSAPAVDQDYVATATLKCMPAGATAVMTVVGTDGYSDTMTYVFQEDTPLKKLSLSVPGASEKGVRDKVTIGVEANDGAFHSKEVSLVFN